ncbi:hypothetical protein CF328_g8511 [Tilletia controversa]|nr:hypothetical protein CF328_g8511 [Tilletia controversa]
MWSTNPAATSAHVPSPRHSTPPISAAPEAPLPRPTLARPSTPTTAEASVVEATRSKPRAPDHWAELQSNWRRKGVLSKVSELFEEAGADETYEDFVDRSYILINEASPSEKDFVDTVKVGSDQYPTRSALERICLFGCGECGKPFTRMANLARHWSLHRRPSIPDIGARSEETIELSRSAEFRGLAVVPAEPPQVPSLRKSEPPQVPSLRKSRAVTTRVTPALGQIAGPLLVQELLPAEIDSATDTF